MKITPFIGQKRINFTSSASSAFCNSLRSFLLWLSRDIFSSDKAVNWFSKSCVKNHGFQLKLTDETIYPSLARPWTIFLPWGFLQLSSASLARQWCSLPVLLFPSMQSQVFQLNPTTKQKQISVWRQQLLFTQDTATLANKSRYLAVEAGDNGFYPRLMHTFIFQQIKMERVSDWVTEF